jgi:hypothetical protein
VTAIKYHSLPAGEYFIVATLKTTNRTIAVVKHFSSRRIRATSRIDEVSTIGRDPHRAIHVTPTRDRIAAGSGLVRACSQR